MTGFPECHDPRFLGNADILYCFGISAQLIHISAGARSKPSEISIYPDCQRQKYKQTQSDLQNRVFLLFNILFHDLYLSCSYLSFPYTIR